MAGVRFTTHSRSYMAARGITAVDIIDVISNYENFQDSLQESGLIRVNKLVRDRMIWVTYVPSDDSLIVVTVRVEEAVT